MQNYNLGFISDENIFNHVKNTVYKYRFSIDLKKFNANLIDPIKLTFDTKIYKKTFQELIDFEVIRQIDRSNTNHIGYFHQNIFRYLGDEWRIPATGYDIINQQENIFVEMKNKHNTMNSSSAQKTYMRMQSTILGNPLAVCMLVEVIAKKSQNVPWHISLDGYCVSNERIRRISIDKFYAMVTGDSLAFQKLCEKLPVIINDVLEYSTRDTVENTVFEELEKIDENLMKSIYMLSFAKYDGFSNLMMKE